MKFDKNIMTFHYLNINLGFYYNVVTKQRNRNSYLSFQLLVVLVNCNTYSYYIVITIIVYQTCPKSFGS